MTQGHEIFKSIMKNHLQTQKDYLLGRILGKAEAIQNRKKSFSFDMLKKIVKEIKEENYNEKSTNKI